MFYRKPLPRIILIAGFVSGLIDITSACIQFVLTTHKNPVRVLQYIASVPFGKERAYSGDVSMMVAGLLIHFLIAYTFTTIFFLIYPRLAFLRRSIVLTAILYGAFIWCVMTLCVLPLLHVPVNHKPSNMIIGCAILMVAFGVTLSLFARTWRRR